MRIILVSGKFDDAGGRPSGFMEKLGDCLSTEHVVRHFSGGHYDALEHLLKTDASRFDAMLWFPDVPNDKPKLVDRIKKIYPTKMLVTSKRNFCEYTTQEVVQRALEVKANLVLMLHGSRNSLAGTVLDPLGNVFCDADTSIISIAACLSKRLTRLHEFKRARSVSMGDETVEIPDESEFFSIVKGYADRFHELIHGVNHTRMMGNASFRCCRGFPSFRHDRYIYVSRRNVDKRFIDATSFVRIDSMSFDRVFYWGDVKPSVDTPIQLMLYTHYENVNYMLHSHTYIEGAPFTDEVIPCGALEEAYAVRKMFVNGEMTNMCINLLGHGSLVMASDVNYLKDISYIARPQPEIIR